MSITLQTTFTPAPNSPKISQLPELVNLTGDELVLLALNGKNYTVPKKTFSSIATGPTLYGSINLYITEVYTFAITNYDMMTTYSVSVSAGTVSAVNPLNGQFTYTAPATASTVTLTINGNTYNLTINPAQTTTPIITAPANLATVPCNTVLVSATAFSNSGPADTQLAANWQLATDAGFTNIVQQSLNDSINLTQYLFENLALSTTYYARVSYVGHLSLISAYSPIIEFTTSAVCYPSQEVYECVSPQIQTTGWYGQAVVATPDGSILAVSAPNETLTSGFAGNVYIYDTTTFPYTLLQTISSTHVSGGSFGSTIELSSDGNYLFIGDPTGTSILSPTLTYAGVVYVYRKISGTFSLIGTIESAVPTANYQFGQYIKLSQDMSTLVISSYAGAIASIIPTVFVYTLNATAGTWTVSTSFSNVYLSTTTIDGYYGLAFDVSLDGKTIAVGSSTNNGGYGVIFVYTNTAGTWSTAQVLPGTGLVNIGSGFGNTLSLSRDGTKLFIGAANNDTVVNGNTYYSQGQVFYYTLTAGTWTLTQTINQNVSNSYQFFGYNVLVSNDSSMLIVIGQEIYVYLVNTSGQYIYSETLESITSNIGSWNVPSVYGYGSGVSNQFVSLNTALNKLFIGNNNRAAETFTSSGIVYTFSCYQNPSLSLIPINNGGSCGSSV